MIFSFNVGLTDSVMQRMQFFFLSVPDLLFNIRKKLKMIYYVCKNNFPAIDVESRSLRLHLTTQS
jgi:hypothetical protein